MLYVAYAVLFLSFINLIRLIFFSAASDIYDIKNLLRAKKVRGKSKLFYSKRYYPLISVLVPAHNEQKTLERNLMSVLHNSYKNVELIIINDSSDDDTGIIARKFQRKYRNNLKGIKVLNVRVRGKARAMNEGLKYARGSLFMCLDADSYLTPNVLKDAVSSFREKSLGSLSSNVKIIPNRGLLNLIQRVEYLICYQMKKAETVTRTQYIVGGIGSMYRMRILKSLDLYETNTITEDIDLSMRMIEKYKNRQYIGYNPNLVVFTEAAVTIPDLIKQRNRWKYGRYQVFLKRQKLFYSKDKNLNPLLSCVFLPYALFAELTFALEPLTIGLIFYLIATYGDFSMVLGSILTFCFYTIIQVTGATQSYNKKEIIKLAAFAPLAYIFMYILTFVEYIATIQGFLSINKLLREYKTNSSKCEWVHIKRADGASST